MVEFLKIGQIINTHGVKGEVKVYPLTDNIKRFSKLKSTLLKRGEEYVPKEIESVKYFKEFVILKLKDVDDLDAAMKYKNEYIYVNRAEAVKLPEDTYFISDLIGLDVYTVEGELLGKLISVFPTGSNDVYEVKPESGKNILLPAIKDVIVDVDITKKSMCVKLLEGLI